MSKQPKPNSPEPPEEELAHYDDAVIGKAFKWSAVAACVIAAGVGATITYLNRKPAPVQAKITEIQAPKPVDRHAQADAPVVAFTDITEAAGIDFTHNSGATGEKLLPETMGGGVTFFDADNDGDQDLLFVNGAEWPHSAAGKAPTTSQLYLNDGKGKFTNATAGSGLDVSFYGMTAASGDFNTDGLPDLFFTCVGQNKLFQNLGGGKFKEIGEQAGVAGNSQQWSTAAAWVDLDNDGDLDLFVGNYVKWSREIDFEVGYKLVGVGRAYGQPMNFEGAFPYLYRNDGNGKFTDVSAEAGIQMKNSATGVPAAKTLGIAPIDLDGDGWMDVILANDTTQNLVFHNQKDGTFKEIGATAGIAFDSYGGTRGAMGIDAGRFRNDEAIGIVIGNFANEMTALYVTQDRPLLFSDEAIPEGIGPASRLLLKFGIFFFDYDLDGRLDVLSANGHLEEEITKIQQSQTYKQPAQLFWNSGRVPAYVPVSVDKAGTDLFKPLVGRGSAYADIDGDGDIDAVLTQTGGKPLLVRNDQALGNNWLRVKLVGKKSNRDAIGAWVTATVDGQKISRHVMAARSYLSQSELPVTLGFGKTSKVESLEVRWPDGSTQKIADIQLNKPMVIEQI